MTNLAFQRPSAARCTGDCRWIAGACGFGAPNAAALVALVLLAWLTGACRGNGPEAAYAAGYRLLRAERFQEALDRAGDGLRQSSRDSTLYWKLRMLEAEIQLDRREPKLAAEVLAVELPPAERTPALLGRFRFLQGYLAERVRDYPAARARFGEAEGLAREARNDELSAEIESREGLLAIDEGRFADAEALSRRVLDYADRHGAPWLALRATGNIGFGYLSSSHSPEAVVFLEKTAKSARLVGAIETEARALGNLGVCYYGLGDLDKALEYYERAISRLQTTGSRSSRNLWLGRVADIHMSRREYAAAVRSYGARLEIARAAGDEAQTANWLANLAKASILNGDPDGAGRANDESLAIARRLKIAPTENDAIINSARIAVEKGQFGAAESLVRGVLASTFADGLAHAQARNLLGIALAGAGKSAPAEAEFRGAIADLERELSQLTDEANKLSYFDKLVGFYQDLIEFLMDSGRTGEALEAADSSHARTMAEKLKLSAPREQRRRGPGEFRKLAAESGSTLLVYSLGIGRSWMWAITAERIDWFRLPPEAEIRALVNRYTATIRDDLGDPIGSGDEAGRRLYEILIAPARGDLADGGRVILVPDGALHGLNFETLPVAGARAHYWLEDAVVSIAPSLGILRTAAAAPKGRSLLLIGDPDSAGPDFPRLAFAEREMASIESSLAGYSQVVLRGTGATPRAWAEARPADSTLIHFTAHATANRIEPLDSAVILSPKNGEDYRLPARDIVATPLHARLVTISACRSAGVRIYAGEGLVGLAWAFLQAGARNAIAGLWDVNDESSARVMEGLYRGIARGETPAVALRSAKLELAHAANVWRKPYYWGGFQSFTTERGRPRF